MLNRLLPLWSSSRLGGPIGVMLQEHEQGRNLVRKMLHVIESIEEGNKNGYMVFSENDYPTLSCLKHIFLKKIVCFIQWGGICLAKKTLRNY